MADLHSEIIDMHLTGPNSCNFMHLLGKFSKNCGGFAPLPQESSGSAIADMLVNVLHKIFRFIFHLPRHFTFLIK